MLIALLYPLLLNNKEQDMKLSLLKVSLTALCLSTGTAAHAALITFDDAISGSTSYGFDGDGDLINDVVFSTTDTFGFNTAGPGPNMLYVSEPGLEGTTTLSPDLRVDFLNGAVNSLSFGFALISGLGIDGVTFTLFDSNDIMLGSASEIVMATLFDGVNPSTFPEAFVQLSFAGVAAYGTFDFSNQSASRYLLDNFSGTFGSTEDITPPTNPPSDVPAPLSLALLGLGLAGIYARRRQ